MPGGHLNGLALLFILIFAAQSVDDAASRIGLYPVGVADDVGATYCNQHDQQCNTKARAGKQGNFCDLLGHTYVKGVEYAGSKSASGTHSDHGSAGYPVKAHWEYDGNTDWDKDAHLGGHAHSGTKDGEEHHKENDDQIFSLPANLGHFAAQGSDGAGRVNDFKGAADHQQENDDVGRIYHGLVHDSRHSQQTDWGLFHPMVGIRYHNGVAGDRVFCSVKFACRNHIGEQRGNTDQNYHDNQCVRCAEPSLFCFCFCCHRNTLLTILFFQRDVLESLRL